MSSNPHEMRFVAIASDMDGTLLRPDHKISPRTARVIHFLQTKRHVPFIFATGRHHSDVLETKKELGIEGYMITGNGARAHDPNNRVLLERNLDVETAKGLAMLAPDDADIATSIYQNDYWFMNKDARDFTEYYQQHKDVFYYQLFNPHTHPSYDGVFKVYYTVDNHDHIPKLHALHQRIAERYGEAVQAAFSHSFALEVSARDVHKGSTLAMLLEKHVVPEYAGQDPIKRCLVFGDAPNDYEMLTMAGKGCVMQNALEILLERLPKGATNLDYIGSNAEDGVALKLMEIFKIDEKDIE